MKIKYILSYLLIFFLILITIMSFFTCFWLNTWLLFFPYNTLGPATDLLKLVVFPISFLFLLYLLKSKKLTIKPF